MTTLVAMPLHPLLCLVALALLIGVALAQRTSHGVQRRSPAQWAAAILPPDGYELRHNDHGVCVITLTRARDVQGVPCAPGRIAFDHRGRLAACALSRDHDHLGLPLRGGTQARFDGRELRLGTLREATVVGGVPCAAGPMARRWDGTLEAQLARDVVLRSIPCRGGTGIRVRLTPLGPRPLVYTPTIPLRRWGMRCAADHEIDELDKSATLHDDHVYDGLTLPGGSRFGHDIDWDDLWVTLSRPITVAGHRLPMGARLCPAHEVIHPAHRRWWRGSAVEEHLTSVQLHETWSLGGVLVAPHTLVRILRSGWAVIRLEDELMIGGLRYPAGSTLTVDASGHVKRWHAGHGDDDAPIAASPYR